MPNSAASSCTYRVMRRWYHLGAYAPSAYSRSYRRTGCGWCFPSHCVYHSRAPGRRCRTSGVTEVAPAAAIARTLARSWSGWSPRNGMTGAISTPQSMPFSLRVRTASRRRAGEGVPGSTVRHSASSTKPTETEIPASVTSAAWRSSSRSRRISVPLVRIENGFA